MAFNFPLNAVDGQTVTQRERDGSVLTATYDATKNQWIIDRKLPAPTTLVGTPPINVTATADGQVITWDDTLKQWVAKAPAAASGGSGGTFAKATQAAPDTPNPPDPGKPREVLREGMLQSTLENLHKELKVWDGTQWAEVLSEDSIKTWISAGSLFRGVVKEASLNTLPIPAVANRGFYYSWTGNPGHVVAATDPVIGTDLLGEVLQVGDWIQSDGAKWVHVPGDLLSKQRWDSLGSFAPWSDTSWEKGSVVSYQQGFWRANALISPGDDPPENLPGNKWTDITPHPAIRLEELSNVETLPPGSYGETRFLTWDPIGDQWVASTTLEDVAGITFDGHPGQVIEEFVSDINTTTNDTSAVPSVEAVKNYIAGLSLESLGDCNELATATDGQVPVWNDAQSRWEPKTLTSPIIYLGTGAWTAANVGDKAQNYGMPADTQPDPKTWAPIAGDQYIDLATGNVTVFTAATGGAAPASPPDRTASGIAGGTGGRKLGGSGGGTLAALTDTNVANPDRGDGLTWDGTKWVNESPMVNITEWKPTVEYRVHEVVHYLGRLWRSQANQINHPPGYANEANWKEITLEISPVFWKPGQTWRKGDLVLVPWYGDSMMKNNIIGSDHTGEYTLWIAKTDLPPDVQIEHNGIALFTNTPPGQFVVQHNDHEHPGNCTSNVDQGWTPLTAPSVHVVADFATLKRLDICCVPGSLFVIASGDKRGEVYEYTAHMDPGRGIVGFKGIGPAFGGSDQHWYSGKDYLPGDIVEYGGKLYINKDDLTKTPPTYVRNSDPVANPGWWTLVGEANDVTKKYVDDAVAPLVTGIKHGAAVLSIVPAPVGVPHEGDLHIVAKNPTGAFATHADEIAFYNNGAWTFTRPGANEAHLNQADNSIYHWSGTAWNKIGSTATSQLDDLTDVDTTTTAPKEGDQLIFRGGLWVPGAAGFAGTHLINSGIQSAGRPYLLDLKTSNWHTVVIDGFIEIRDDATHVSWTGEKADGTPVLMVANLTNASAMITYAGGSGTNGRGYITYDNEFHAGADKFGLTWLVGTAGQADRISHTKGNYCGFQMKLHRWYDNYITVTSRIVYAAYSSNTYEIDYIWQFNNNAMGNDLSRIKFTPVSSIVRMAIGGSYTLS